MKFIRGLPVYFFLSVLIGIACFFTINETGAAEKPVKQEAFYDLSVEEAKNKASIEFSNLSEFPFPVQTSVKLKKYKYQNQVIHEIIIMNESENGKSQLNIIISPSKGNLQHEESDKETKKSITLADGTTAYYYVKDLGEQIRFEKDGVSYGLYHLIQFNEPLGQEKMIKLANKYTDQL